MENKSKRRKKRKLSQKFAQPNKNNESNSIKDDRMGNLLAIIIVLAALAFLISSAFRVRSGYDWYPGRVLWE